jgi:hypothetical protein
MTESTEHRQPAAGSGGDDNIGEGMRRTEVCANRLMGQAQ